MLLVDDDRQTLEILVRILEREGYRCTPAGDIAEARERLESAPYDLIVCDVRLPDGSGLDLVAAELPHHESMAAVMISGLDDGALAERSIQLGAYGYIVKPFSANEVLIAVLGALRNTRAKLDARGELRAAQEETIHRLCIAVEARDSDAAPHISQMSGYCWHIGRALDLGPEECQMLRIASPMHDVGNVAVPDRILFKSGVLTRSERAAMERHAEMGYRILAGSRAQLLRVASTIALTHHERFDGSGYPRAMAGAEIPLEGRIAAVADVFVALTRDRVHRDRLSRATALEIMVEGRGSWFDPEVLDAFLAVDERLAMAMTAPDAGLPSLTGEGPAATRLLSRRERQVLQLAADGRPAMAIAEELFVSPGTVKTHFQRIYAKLDVRDRASAVATALRRGLID